MRATLKRTSCAARCCGGANNGFAHELSAAEHQHAIALDPDLLLSGKGKGFAH